MKALDMKNIHDAIATLEKNGRDIEDLCLNVTAADVENAGGEKAIKKSVYDKWKINLELYVRDNQLDITA